MSRKITLLEVKAQIYHFQVTSHLAIFIRVWSRPIISACEREKLNSTARTVSYFDNISETRVTDFTPWWDIENIFIFTESPSSLCIASVNRAQHNVLDRHALFDGDFHGSNRWIVNQKSAIGQRSSLPTLFRSSRYIFHTFTLSSSSQMLSLIG